MPVVAMFRCVFRCMFRSGCSGAFSGVEMEGRWRGFTYRVRVRVRVRIRIGQMEGFHISMCLWRYQEQVTQ